MEINPVSVQLKNYSLRNVVFDLQKCEENKEYKIQFADRIDTVVLNEFSFDVLFTRTAVSGNPFKLEVCYGVTVEADVKDLASNEETIQEFAERKKLDIVKKIRFPSRASIIISEITRESGSILITAPGIISDNE